DTDHKYWLRPGAFCDVNVPIGDARQGIVVPSLSVQPTDKGNVVYTVDAGNIAHLRTVTLGMHTPEGGVEVTEGLTAGELLVVRGFEPLSEGAPVQITDRTTLNAATIDDGGAATPPAGSGSAGGPNAQTPPPIASATSSAGEHHRKQAAPLTSPRSVF